MSLAAAHGIEASGAVHSLVYRPSPGPGAPACWLALPHHMSAEMPPIVAIHGIRRNAGQQAELFARRATRLGRPVIAPLFERDQWPRYQQVVRCNRADLALLALMAQLRLEGIWHTPRFELCGFSGGAQFAHRFAMLHPEMVCRLTTVSAGWYTFPDAAPFPYGLAPRTNGPDPWPTVTEDKLRRFLAIPIKVCVGENDTVVDHNTRSSPEIDAQQGTNRLCRAIRWASALKCAAGELGVTARVVFRALSGCGHDFRQCVIRGGLDRIVIPDDAWLPTAGADDASASEMGRECLLASNAHGAQL